MEDLLLEYGMQLLENENHKIQLISIIGEIEGHDGGNGKTKVTKYEHMLPILASLEWNNEIDGILFMINTVGGDVSCGLALAEMIAALTKPTVSLVIGDSHSIGVPLSVAADYTLIAPSSTVVIHPVRMSGMVLGAPQTYEYFGVIQDRISDFIAKHSKATKEQIEKWMINPGILSRDLGTIFVGQQAVDAGLFQEVGGIRQGLDYLQEKIEQLKNESDL